MNINFRQTIAAILTALSTLSPIAMRAEWNDSIKYKAEIGTAVGGGDHNPFWLANNKQGFSSVEKNNLWLRLSAFKELDDSKRFSWGAGVDMGVAYRFSSIFVPQQLYAEVKYRCLDAMIGAKDIYDEFLDPSLSSGALTNGWNSHAIPQLRVGIFDYADVWGCKEMFAIKGHIAYGMFDDNWWLNRWVNNNYKYTLSTLYCSRAISFRFGNAKKFPLEGELGLRMDTEFGGKTWWPAQQKFQKHPVGWKDFIKACIPMGGSSETDAGEQLNVQGNMLGNWNLGLKWQDPSGWMVRAYYQHYFEDHSMLFFDYVWKDGLYGVQAKLPKNRFVSEVAYEFLFMKDQGGAVYWDHTPEIDYQVSGRDSYYYNYIYNSYQHWGMTIGNPLLTSPIYNSNHQLEIFDTRISSHHFAIKGEPSDQVDYRLMATHTRSWGTYFLPYNKVKANFSFLAEVKYHPKRLKGWEGGLSFAFDKGNIVGNSYGAMISISKSGWFK